MFARFVSVCVGIVLLTSAAIAEEAPANPAAAPAAAPSPAATRADLESIATRLEEKMIQRFQTIEEQISQSRRERQDQAERIVQLEDKVRALSDAHQSGQQILEQIAKRDNSGKSYLRIDASHEPTRDELRRAILESAPKTGKVIIRNKMSTDEPVAINGKTYDVLANSEREVTVDYGSFCVKLRGRDKQTRNFSYPNTETVVTVVPEYPQWVSGSPGYWTYVAR